MTGQDGRDKQKRRGMSSRQRLTASIHLSAYLSSFYLSLNEKLLLFAGALLIKCSCNCSRCFFT